MEWTALYRDIVGRLEEGASLSAIASDLERLSAQEPHSQRVAVLKAVLAERSGDPQEAMRLLQSVIASQTDNAVARSNLARLQWKAGQIAEALASLRFSLLQDPQQERALHLYAALLEQQGGWGQAVSALKLLSQGPAHLPAWVAAELAASRALEQLPELLLLSARQSRAPFPPELATLTRLLAALPPEQQRETASALRPFCHPQAAAAIDELLARTSAPPPSQGSSSAYRLQRSVWRHLAEPLGQTALGLSPVCLVRPESWGVGEIAGRLGRGFALLVTEQLDSCGGPPASVLLETVAPSGLVTRSAPQSGEALATLAAGTCHRLVSSYLSFQEPDRFILDVEHYDGQGRYLARESHRASHPGECLRQLADRLTALSPEPAPAASPPPPHLDLDDALARDAVAALVLCSEGALHSTSLGNPGLLLDSLVSYAVQSESHSALLCLWAAIEAAARANLPSATEQRPIVQQILDANPNLAAWLRASR